MLSTTPRRQHPGANGSALATGVVCVLVALAFVTWRSGERVAAASTQDLLAAVLYVAVLLFGYLVLGAPSVRRAMRARVGHWPALSFSAFVWPSALWVATVAYAARLGLPIVPRALGYALYLAVPVVLLRVGRASGDSGVADAGSRVSLKRVEIRRGAAAVVWLFIPAALRMLPRIPVPDTGGTDVSKYIGIGATAWCFLVVAPLPNVGYRFRLDRRSALTAGLAAAVYAGGAVPVGLATGFLTWGPRLDARRLLLLPVLLAITTALAEELVFRGVVQRSLEVATARMQWGRWIALGVASVLFGLAHLPDPRYALLATCAGVAYGLVYQRTGRLLAAVLTHTLVDWAWAVLLRG